MFTHAFALSSPERRRAKNMANQSKMQLSLLDIGQHELLLIVVAYECMQLKTHNKRRKHDVTYLPQSSPQQVLLLYCPTCYDLTGHPCVPVASDYRGGCASELAQ